MITYKSFRRFLNKAFCQWGRAGKLKTSLIGYLQTHIGTENNAVNAREHRTLGDTTCVQFDEKRLNFINYGVNYARSKDLEICGTWVLIIHLDRRNLM